MKLPKGSRKIIISLTIVALQIGISMKLPKGSRKLLIL